MYIVRFFGFFVYLLNIMDIKDGVVCFYDIKYIREKIFNFINIICFMDIYGRYIIYYNNRIYFLILVDYY